MDLGDCRKHDLIFSDALAMWYHMSDNQERNTKCEVDAGLYTGADGSRSGGVLFIYGSRERFGVSLNMTDNICMSVQNSGE